MKYFVSYTTRDEEVTKNILETFSKRLRKLGDVFIDIIDNNSSDKQERVISELDNCDILILIESKSIFKSEWVSIELERAKSKKIPIITISLTELNSLTEIEIVDKLSFRKSDVTLNKKKPCR